MLPKGDKFLNVVLGGSAIGDMTKDSMARFDTPEEVAVFLTTFINRGYNQVDTSRMYSPQAPKTSEPRIGATSIKDKLIIDTKVTSNIPNAHTTANVLAEIDASLKALKIKQINIEYLHVPDRGTPFEEACVAMDRAYREGKIKHWGICSYSAEEVQSIIDMCEKHGYVKPSVYQGQYNAIVRGGEKELFPVLRKNGMAFYAFSPAGGGFFAGNHKKASKGGRYDKTASPLPLGAMYGSFYVQPAIEAATEKALAVASKHGIGGHAAALRWTVYHSILDKDCGDSILVGASSPAQLESNLDMIEAGPLPGDVVAAMDAVYAQAGDQVPYYL